MGGMGMTAVPYSWQWRRQGPDLGSCTVWERTWQVALLERPRGCDLIALLDEFRHPVAALAVGNLVRLDVDVWWTSGGVDRTMGVSEQDAWDEALRSMGRRHSAWTVIEHDGRQHCLSSVIDWPVAVWRDSVCVVRLDPESDREPIWAPECEPDPTLLTGATRAWRDHRPQVPQSRRPVPRAAVNL